MKLGTFAAQKESFLVVDLLTHVLLQLVIKRYCILLLLPIFSNEKYSVLDIHYNIYHRLALK